MKPFSILHRSGNPPFSLVWKQPRFGEDYYELGDNPASDALYASIGWPKWLSDLAVAHSAVGTWYFDRLGWTRSTIVVNIPLKSSENPGMGTQIDLVKIAGFEVGWFWEGDLIQNSGEIFHWFRTKTFHNAWALSEVISDEGVTHAQTTTAQAISAKSKQKRKEFFRSRQPKPLRKERCVYEIEFGRRWFKQEAWITLPTLQAAHHQELIFLLCTGMYLGHCMNQDSAAVAAASTTAVIS